MHHLYQLQILKEFTCIGGDCPQTCCSGWRIPLHEQDLHYYKKHSNSFGHFIKNLDFEQKCVRTIDKRCSNLNSDGLCEFQKQHSHKALPLTCKIYPRIFLDYKKDIYVIGALSCPEIVNLIFDSTNVLWTPKKKISSQFQKIQRKHIIDCDYIDEYIDIISLLRTSPINKEIIHDFFSKRIDLFHIITKTPLSLEYVNVETLSQSLLTLTRHINTHFFKNLFPDLENIDGLTFLSLTKQKFLSIPKEIRKKIWSVFFKTFYVNSFFFVRNRSVKNAIYWQSLYMTFFFVTGSWLPDDQKNNLEHWKKVVYKFGRISQASSFDFTAIPVLNIHTIIVHLLYDELWDKDLL